MRFANLLRLLPFIRPKKDPPGLPLHEIVSPTTYILTHNDYWTADKYRIYNQSIWSTYPKMTEIVYKQVPDPTDLETIQYTLDQLPSHYRQIYYMRYYTDNSMFTKHSVRAICKKVGITPNVYYIRMREIKDHLRGKR